MKADERHADLVIRNTSEVLTCAADAPDGVGRILGGEIVIDGDRIVAVGTSHGYRARRYLDAEGGVVMPGFVDAHTHVVFGGSRVEEYAARVGGGEPPPGAAVGIMGTVSATRATSYDDLVLQSRARLDEMLISGTTTVESKSGYGLAPDVERRLLQINAELNDSHPIDIVSTYLGAHAIPDDLTPDEYVDQIVDLIPEIASEHLADFCDVYCDEGYFTVAQTRRILETGLAHGLAPKLHLDAYSHTGAALLAVELAATSVDHMNCTPVRDLEQLAQAGVVGVYMPCLDLAVAHPRPFNARAATEVGMELALATDICPGCWVTDMQLVIALACRNGGMTVAGAIRAATHGAALAVGRADDVGSLVPGKLADVIVLDVPRHEELAYRIGRNSVRTVIKAGQVVVGGAS